LFKSMLTDLIILQGQVENLWSFFCRLCKCCLARGFI
jgi:hypothetical protein